ncbi:replication initiation protein RepM (plasmid) [Halomonas sp. Bachu 37]|uniref:replication initiation protein RepM n=1 Tax=Halomonas kashgarensis TaxID=3084920 RepID=UPI0032162AC7
MAKEIVKKSNVLATAAYTVTLAEQRLILLAIVQGNGDKEALKQVEIHASQYADKYKVTPSAAYKALHEASLQLFERRFSYQEEGKRGPITRMRRWVQGVDYGEADGILRLIFSDDVLPSLCELHDRFLYYGLEQVADLTSVHAVRLYELLIAWRSTGKTPVIKVADLRRQLGIEPDEYGRMTDFKRRVLDFAIKQINEHTDIKASYIQHKRGRSITGFEFSFTAKANAGTKRKTISKSKAEAMARPGESYSDLYKRLSREYIIKE